MRAIVFNVGCWCCTCVVSFACARVQAPAHATFDGAAGGPGRGNFVSGGLEGCSKQQVAQARHGPEHVPATRGLASPDRRRRRPGRRQSAGLGMGGLSTSKRSSARARRKPLAIFGAECIAAAAHFALGFSAWTTTSSPRIPSASNNIICSLSISCAAIGPMLLRGKRLTK